MPIIQIISVKFYESIFYSYPLFVILCFIRLNFSLSADEDYFLALRRRRELEKFTHLAHQGLRCGSAPARRAGRGDQAWTSLEAAAEGVASSLSQQGAVRNRAEPGTGAGFGKQQRVPPPVVWAPSGSPHPTTNERSCNKPRRRHRTKRRERNRPN